MWGSGRCLDNTCCLLVLIWLCVCDALRAVGIALAVNVCVVLSNTFLTVGATRFLLEVAVLTVLATRSLLALAVLTVLATRSLVEVAVLTVSATRSLVVVAVVFMTR